MAGAMQGQEAGGGGGGGYWELGLAVEVSALCVQGCSPGPNSVLSGLGPADPPEQPL